MISLTLWAVLADYCMRASAAAGQAQLLMYCNGRGADSPREHRPPDVTSSGCEMVNATLSRQTAPTAVLSRPMPFSWEGGALLSCARPPASLRCFRVAAPRKWHAGDLRTIRAELNRIVTAKAVHQPHR